MKNQPKILIINPGSTSTKIAVYVGSDKMFDKNISHTREELSLFSDIIDQLEYRKKLILDSLVEFNQPLSEIDIVMGRGGLVRPIESGVYEVNELLLTDLKEGYSGKHASNLGGILSHEIAEEVGAKAYIADPVVVDEMADIARISGIKELPRKSIFHALNQKAIAREYAQSIAVSYEELNLIVAHLGGGVSVGAHQKGLVVDVNNALSGEGPFSPERSGTIIADDLLNLAFSGRYSHSELHSMVVGSGGFMSHLGSADVKSVVERAEAGSEDDILIVDAFVYNVSKSIGAMSTVLSGNVDAIIITGGIAYSNYITSRIEKRVSHLSKVVVIAGEDEIKALAQNGLMVYEGKLSVKKYC